MFFTVYYFVGCYVFYCYHLYHVLKLYRQDIFLLNSFPINCPSNDPKWIQGLNSICGKPGFLIWLYNVTSKTVRNTLYGIKSYIKCDISLICDFRIFGKLCNILPTTSVLCHKKTEPNYVIDAYLSVMQEVTHNFAYHFSFYTLIFSLKYIYSHSKFPTKKKYVK